MDVQRIVVMPNKEINTSKSDLQKYQSGLDKLGMQKKR